MIPIAVASGFIAGNVPVANPMGRRRHMLSTCPSVCACVPTYVARCVLGGGILQPDCHWLLVLKLVNCVVSCIGNKRVPKTIINNTINLFFKLQLAFWQFQTITVSECCLTKLLSVYFIWKYIYILALKMASQGNNMWIVSAHFGSLYTPWAKKQDIKLFPITSPNVNQFLKFFR